MLGDRNNPYDNRFTSSYKPNELDLGKYYYITKYYVYDLNFVYLYTMNTNRVERNAIGKCELRYVGPSAAREFEKWLDLQSITIRTIDRPYVYSTITQFDDMVSHQTGIIMMRILFTSVEIPVPVYQYFIRAGNFYFSFISAKVFLKEKPSSYPPGYPPRIPI